jgi:SET domain-containing protein
MASSTHIRQTAFVREVLLPDAPDIRPTLVRKHCRFRLRADQSSIHRWGIFADEAIPSRRRVIEYTGRRIAASALPRLHVRTHVYTFWLSATHAIDGAIGGSGAQWINHSCDPNLYARTSRGHIYLISRRPIAAGDELTFDYRIRGASHPLPCQCGSPLCRGWMNAPFIPE